MRLRHFFFGLSVYTQIHQGENDIIEQAVGNDQWPQAAAETVKSNTENSGDHEHNNATSQPLIKM